MLLSLVLLIGAGCSSDPDPEQSAEIDSEIAERADSTGSGDESDGGTAADGGSDTTEPPAASEPFEPSLTDAEVAERLAALGGRLAIGNGPELSIVRPDGTSVRMLDGSESVLASQPTWSHDGTKLAWSSSSALDQTVVVQSFAEDGSLDGDPVSADASGNPVFYLQWNEGDDRLAYIRNAPQTGAVEVGVVEPGSPIEPIGEGAPFFISWSPAPDRILGHVNQLSVDAFDASDPLSAGFVGVTAVDGGFSAPAWVDERRAIIVADGALAYLDVEAGTTEAIIELDGPIRFVLSPDRTRVAYQALDAGDDLSVVGLPAEDARRTAQADRSGLTVLDLATVERTLVTSSLAAAWEWSPDSSKLAWMGAEIESRRPIGQWRFWEDGERPTTTQSARFAITRKFGQAYLPFFAQYTQSVTGWSPDSTAFAFTGSIGSDRGVWIQLVSERVAPRLVAPGDFVTWGPGELAPRDPDGAPAA